MVETLQDAVKYRGSSLADEQYVDLFGKPGEKFLDWIGGYFEADWSVNPHWTANFEKFPDHPVARGVKPFKIRDEWYYNIRFAEGMKNVTPILRATPPDNTRGTAEAPPIASWSTTP